MELYYVLMTVILLKQPMSGSEKPGDVLISRLVGASDTLEDCRKAGPLTAAPIQKEGGDVVKVVTDCVKLPASIGEAQGFTPVDEIKEKKEK